MKYIHIYLMIEIGVRGLGQGGNRYNKDMNESGEAHPTIRDFVFQDAQEKAFETHLRGIKEYEQEKKSIFHHKMEQVTQDAEKRVKEGLVEKRIQKSALINKSRMDKMVLRNEYSTCHSDSSTTWSAWPNMASSSSSPKTGRSIRSC